MFVQGNAYDSVYRYERHIVFPKLLSQNCPDFAQNQTIYNADLEKEGTTRRWKDIAASVEIFKKRDILCGYFDFFLIWFIL